jgi:hypothetical protein
VAVSGDYTTAQVTESGNLYFTNARAIASTLTGYTSGAGTITSSDSILSAIQKLNGNIGALTTGVSSVNGLTGAVTLTTSNIAEGTNLYYTEARVNANTNVAANTAARHNAVTLGTANGLSLSTQVLSLGLASTSTTGALSSTDWNTFNNKTSNTGTVTSVGLSSATSGVTIGSTPITTSGTITLAIATASGSQQGLLSSTDWTTFNNKQNALTNPVTGTGTTNYLPKFTGASTIGNSNVQDNGSTVSISTNSTVLSLDRTGAGTALIELKTNGTVRSYFGADASVPFIFFTQSASELMRLNASGNLSIGNTNDTYKLDVTGTGRFTGNLSAGTTNTAGGDNIISVTNGGGTLYTTRSIIRSTVAGIGAELRTVYGTNAAYFGTTSNSNLYFITNDTVNATLDSAGNLGLGVTPSAGLATANYRLFEIGLDGGGSLYSGSNQTLYGTNISWVGGTPNYVRTGSSPTLYNQSNGAHSWSTAPTGTAGNAISFTQAMTLNASGNLGLGTTLPATKLDVTGRIRSSDYMNAYDGTRDMYMNPAANFGFGALPAIQVASNHALQLATNNGLAVLITADRNVEIITGSIKTGAPSSGSAQPWKLGSYAAGGTGTATGVIYIEVNGQIYSIPAYLGTP